MTKPMAPVASDPIAGQPTTSSVPTAGGAAKGERDTVARAYEKWLRQILPAQRLDGSDQDGGFEDGQTGWCDGRETAFRLARLIAARCWFKHLPIDRLGDAISRAAKFLVRRQAPDGRLDMVGMYSANEAGFPVPGLVAAYKHLQRADGELFEQIEGDLRRFLQRAAQAALAGAAHTANHRWAAACAPLAAVHTLWPDDRYLNRIKDYLADGIDCDEDGFWYEERSPNYNMVANHGLMVMADCLNRPELLQPVVRNLGFILYNLQPNGEIDASFSHRQDRAAANKPPCTYSVARRVAQLTGDGRFSALALAALQNAAGLPGELMPLPFELDNHPQPLPPPRPLPATYEKLYERRGIMRWRRDGTAVTLTADPGHHFYDTVLDQWGGRRVSDDWFHLHHGDIVLQSLHLAPAGMFAIQPRTLERSGPGMYKLAGCAEGWEHTLHFRPGSPHVLIPWDLEHAIEARWDGPALYLRLACTTPHALIGSLNLWLRPGVELVEGNEARKPQAGDVVSLRGGTSLTIRSKTAEMRVDGLPPAAHHMPILPRQPIPSVMPRTCAAVCLGVRFPIRLELCFRFSAVGSRTV